MADAAFDEFGNFIGAGEEDGSDYDGSASDAPVHEERGYTHNGFSLECKISICSGEGAPACCLPGFRRRPC